MLQQTRKVNAVARDCQLELVADLSNFEFLLALRRFISRNPAMFGIIYGNERTFSEPSKKQGSSTIDLSSFSKTHRMTIFQTQIAVARRVFRKIITGGQASTDENSRLIRAQVSGAGNGPFGSRKHGKQSSHFVSRYSLLTQTRQELSRRQLCCMDTEVNQSFPPHKSPRNRGKSNAIVFSER